MTNTQQSFGDYLVFLRESIKNLSDYWQLIGRKNRHIEDIRAGLNHKDPFIIYKATMAATALLEDKSIYH